MEIQINEKNKIIEIWLTKDEANSESTNQMIKLIGRRYIPSKFKLVVFKSGKQELFSNTESLIMTNRKAMEPAR